MRFVLPMLALVPVALVLEYGHIGGPTAVFLASALSLIPLAALLGRATEEAAIYTGPRIGALLNATLGNAAELIITIIALREGLVDLVKASIAGSIIGNILVVLGLSLLLGRVEERHSVLRCEDCGDERDDDGARGGFSLDTCCGHPRPRGDATVGAEHHLPQ